MDRLPQHQDLTHLLIAWRGGDRGAFDQFLAQVYRDLRRIAEARLRRDARGATLSPTELVHEAVLGMMRAETDFNDRAHFFATLSMAMRTILIDHARARVAEKRGGERLMVSLSKAEAHEEAMAFDLLALEQALQALEAIDARSAQVMHLSCFGDLDQEQIAHVLGVSVPTVKRDLRFARAHISKALDHG